MGFRAAPPGLHVLLIRAQERVGGEFSLQHGGHGGLVPVALFIHLRRIAGEGGIVRIGMQGEFGVRLRIFMRAIERRFRGQRLDPLQAGQNCCAVPSNILPQPSAKMLSPTKAMPASGK